MRAALFHGEKDLRIEDVPEPECKPGHVKVAPAFCGICGTDLHEYSGGPSFAPVKQPHPITKETVPIGFGHEFSGTVTEIGDGVEGLTVAIKPNLQCFHCRACQSGADCACSSAGFIGLSGGGGGLSESIVVPKHMVFPLPSNVPLDWGALVEPLAVGWHAVSMSGMMPGDKVLVLGGGPIGQAVLQACCARQAGTVVMAEVAAKRQMFARRFGADHVVNPLVEDTVSKTRELLGESPDVVFECAGVPASINAAVEVIKGRGTIVNLALWEKPANVQINWLVLRESRVIGVLGYTKEDYEFVIEALRTGAIQPGEMITKRIKLDDVVKEGLETLLKEKDDHVKILVDVRS